MIPSLVTSD